MAHVHTVKQGECLSGIAEKYGFRDWKTIYEHPENKSFKRDRPNPNVIYPGDQVFIPDKNAKQESLAAGRLHQFKVKKTKTELCIVMKDHDDKPLKNEAYTLTVAGESSKGRTNSDGLIQEVIPVQAQDAELALDNFQISWHLSVGGLDPIREPGKDEPIISGVQARLNNLGFDCGEVDGVLGPRTKASVALFQQFGLGRENPDGKLDRETLDALVDQHGC